MRTVDSNLTHRLDIIIIDIIILKNIKVDNSEFQIRIIRV